MVIILIFVRCPPYGVFRILIHYDIFVFRRTSGINTCHNVNSAKLADLSFFKALKTWFGLLFK